MIDEQSESTGETPEMHINRMVGQIDGLEAVILSYEEEAAIDANRIAELEAQIKTVKGCRRFRDNTYLGINPDPEGEYFGADDVLQALESNK